MALAKFPGGSHRNQVDADDPELKSRSAAKYGKIFTGRLNEYVFEIWCHSWRVVVDANLNLVSGS